MILVNFKIYPQTFGDGAIKLARIIKSVSDKFKIKIVIAATTLDAVRIKEQTDAEVWLQNVDQYNNGKHTGYISMEQSLALGINTSLINHFEHQSPKGLVSSIITDKPTGFRLMCCAKSVGQIEKWIVKANPDYILYEPPQFIGSNISSVASQPDSIKRAVEASGKIPLMIGAGIKSKEDVVISLKMGAKSVGLASSFVLSPDPQRVLEEIASGFAV